MPERTVKLSLEEWDELVGRHLQLIEAGAEICERHAKQLMGMPDWQTRAAQDVARVERLLSSALTTIVRTRQEMERKQRVG
jgi:hypothetical protein